MCRREIIAPSAHCSPAQCEQYANARPAYEYTHAWCCLRPWRRWPYYSIHIHSRPHPHTARAELYRGLYNVRIPNRAYCIPKLYAPQSSRARASLGRTRLVSTYAIETHIPHTGAHIWMCLYIICNCRRPQCVLRFGSAINKWMCRIWCVEKYVVWCGLCV